MGDGWQHPKISLVQLSFGLLSKPQYMQFEIGILFMHLFFANNTTYKITLLHFFIVFVLIRHAYLKFK